MTPSRPDPRSSHRSWRRYRDWPLPAKMMALLMAASSLPLFAVAAVALRAASVQVRKDATDLLTARAEQLAAELDDFHRGYVASARRFVEFPEISQFLLSKEGDRAELQGRLLTLLGIHLRADPSIRGLAVVGEDGTVLAATEAPLVGSSMERQSHDRHAVTEESTVSDVYISSPETGSIPSIAYMTPVETRQGRVVGFVALYVRAVSFWQAVREGNGRAGQGSFAFVLDRHGIRIGHSGRDDTVFHPAGDLDAETIEALVSKQRFGHATRDLLGSPIPAPELFEAARSRATEAVFRSFGHKRGQWNLAVARRLQTTPWTICYLVPEDALFAPVQRLVREILVTSGAIMALALAVGLLLSGRIIRPAGQLASAAKRISEGDLTARVGLERRDELGELAENFNRMADTLAASQLTLEAKVLERTEALEAAKTELESRNRKLSEWSSEIAHRQMQDLVYARTLAALSGGGSLGTLLPVALQEVAGAVGVGLAVCYRLTSDRSFRPIREPSAQTRESLLPAAAGEAADEAISRRVTVVLDPVPFDVEKALERVPGARIKDLAVVPLIVEDRTIGVLLVGSAPGFTVRALSFLEDLAVPLALTIVRHDLHEQTNRFADQLAARNKTLRLQAEELASQRDELRAQHRALEAKSREVEKANQLKSEFLANMSHELRTPLNAVIGFSDLLLEETRESLSPRQIRWVEDILASGRHLLNLINDILDLAKIEAGRASLALEPLDPQDTIADAVALIEPEARRRRIEIRTVVRGHSVANADRGKLRQVLLNLLSNSVKFSPAGCTVEVGSEADGRFVRFWVQDEGPGIEESLRKELFKPFVQGESALVKKHQGTGLGLVISKRLVEQHGGTIELGSHGGPGLRVSFTIPAADAVSAGPCVLAHELHEPSPESSLPAAATVLVVDDHDLNRELSRALLERKGYRVLTAGDGAAGVDLARRNRPDLILMDLAMPVKDGFAAARELKGDPTTASIPIVALTALAMRGDQSRAFEAGFDGYLTKPIEASALDLAVSKFLSPKTAV